LTQAAALAVNFLNRAQGDRVYFAPADYPIFIFTWRARCHAKYGSLAGDQWEQVTLGKLGNILLNVRRDAPVLAYHEFPSIFDGNIALLIQFITAEFAGRHDNILPVEPLLLVTKCALFDMRRDQEIHGIRFSAHRARRIFLISK
jgi:hypothetical protein